MFKQFAIMEKLAGSNSEDVWERLIEDSMEIWFYFAE
jgi:hypothetical protein